MAHNEYGRKGSVVNADCRVSLLASGGLQVNTHMVDVLKKIQAEAEMGVDAQSLAAEALQRNGAIIDTIANGLRKQAEESAADKMQAIESMKEALGQLQQSATQDDRDFSQQALANGISALQSISLRASDYGVTEKQVNALIKDVAGAAGFNMKYIDRTSELFKG